MRHTSQTALICLFLSPAVGAQLLDASPDLVLQIDQAGAAFGAAVASAGDVNGDGFSDVLVGAPSFDLVLGDEGAAFLFLGSAQGLATTPAWFAGGSNSGARFGERLACAGDVNGDGFDDVVIAARGAPGGGLDEGRAYVYHGSPTGLGAAPAVVLDPGFYALLYGVFGMDVTGRGDVDGNGFADVFVGMEADGCGHAGASCLGGLVLGYFGSANGLASGPSWASRQGSYLSGFGETVSCVGDVDRDGFDDLAIGAQRADVVELHHGTAAGPSGPQTLLQGAGVDLFGRDVARAGDTNGDGIPDLLVAASASLGPEAFLFRGTAAGISPFPWWSSQGLAGSGGEHTVAGVGDLDHDGLDEVLVGSPMHSTGQANEGRLALFRGHPEGASTRPCWTDESQAVGARLGASVAGAGDVDGDGFLDVLAGAPGASLGQAQEGAVAVYLGRPRGSGRLRGLQQRLTSDASPIALGGRSDAPDAFRVRTTVVLDVPRIRRIPQVPLRAWLELQVVPVGQSYVGAPLVASAPQRLRRGPLAFDVLVSGLQPDTVHAWRVRVATNHPAVPRSVWFTLPGRSASEGKVRTAP